MRVVFPDTSWYVAALLSAPGRRRKLLVVFAYGMLACCERFGPDLERRYTEGAENEGGILQGRPLGRLLRDAGERKAALAEQLPPLTPDDLCLVGSKYLFDEIERVGEERGGRIARGVQSPAGIGLLARRQAMALSAAVVEDPSHDDVPMHTEHRDRGDDILIEACLNARAQFLLSDDKKHIALSSDEPTDYTHPVTGVSIQAIQFAPFVQEQVNTYHFDLDAVDGDLLTLAHSLLSPTA